jgi:pimeloyl-ACP methyl ester carboxylesterase
MSERAIWFGPEARPLFGVLHTPDTSEARGGVVLCPTLGVEAMSSHRALRELALRLEAVGLLALRFDYEGTGDSAGDESTPAQVEGWTRSIETALDLLRSAGADRLGLVGFRIGGTMAAVVAQRIAGLNCLALWDPCMKGRSFVREQQAIKAMGIGETPTAGVPGLAEGGVEILGSVLSPEVVADLGRIDLAALQGTLAERVLVLARPDRPVPRRAGALGGPGVEWDDAKGQESLVDVLPDEVVIPSDTIARVTDWIAGAVGGPGRAVVTVGRDTALVAGGEGGSAVLERPVRLGPLGLFGLVAEPASGPAGGPTVAFLNAGLLHHVGPARLWVSLARRFAAAGIRSVRFDLSGLGDSPERPGQARNFSYPKEAISDIADVVGSVCPDGGEVVLIGLCAGAYHAIEGGIALGVRGVCAINPILHFDPPDIWADPAAGFERQVLQPLSPWIKALRRFEVLGRLGEHRVPPALWWLLDKSGMQAHPARALEKLAARGVDTLLVCGDVEALPFQRRAKWAMRRLVASGATRFEILHGTDHTLFGASARARATSLIAEHVLKDLGAGHEVVRPVDAARSESLAPSQIPAFDKESPVR